MFISTITVFSVLCDNRSSLLLKLISLLEIPKVTGPLSGPSYALLLEKCIHAAISILHFNISNKVNHTIPYVQGEIWMKITCKT